MRKRAAILILVVVAAACSGGGGGGATTATIDPTVRDQLTADAAVLQASDVSGFFPRPNTTPTTRSEASESVSGAVAECFQTNDAKTASSVREFVNGPQLRHTVLRGEVETHADASSLTGKLAAFTPSDASACMKRFTARLFAAEGGVIGDVAVVPSTVTADFDEKGGFVFTVPVSADGDFTIGIEIVFGRLDRFRSTTTIVTFDETPDHSVAVAAMQAMIGRLQQ